MKVAFLFRGAVSHRSNVLSSRTVVTGNKELYVNYLATKKSIQKHIIEVNPEFSFDFFLHGWNIDLDNDLVQLYKPLSSKFEPNSNYEAEINKKISQCGVSKKHFGQLSSCLSLKKVTQLLLDHSNVYDLIIFYRYDVLLWKDIDLKKYLPNKIWINADRKKRFAGDFHFITDYQNGINFGLNLYDSFNNILKPIDHRYIPKYVKENMNLEIQMDDIVAGEHQEVTRKLKSTGITDLQLSNYNLTRKQINQYQDGR